MFLHDTLHREQLGYLPALVLKQSRSVPVSTEQKKRTNHKEQVSILSLCVDLTTFLSPKEYSNPIHSVQWLREADNQVILWMQEEL